MSDAATGLRPRTLFLARISISARVAGFSLDFCKPGLPVSSPGRPELDLQPASLAEATGTSRCARSHCGEAEVTTACSEAIEADFVSSSAIEADFVDVTPEHARRGDTRARSWRRCVCARQPSMIWFGVERHPGLFETTFKDLDGGGEELSNRDLRGATGGLPTRLGVSVTFGRCCPEESDTSAATISGAY